jgi:pyridoxal phosphate enzyme (YggS family)
MPLWPEVLAAQSAGNPPLPCYDFTGPAMATSSTIRENLERVREKIETAARRVSRKPEEILLIGVSKTHPAGAIREAYQAGLHHFGENRVQEWEGKLGALADLQATWHLIGHLQSNKAARAAKAFHSVDSVDDWSLAQRLDRAQAEKGTVERLRVLIEVHMGGEETKSGASEADLPQLTERVMTLTHLEFAGLMCIPPFRENPDEVRPFFETLRKYKEQLEARIAKPLPVLSMGMSHDFEAAILEGSTEVRIGTAIFGTRPKGP